MSDDWMHWHTLIFMMRIHNLSDFEEEFLKSISKRKELSDKQKALFEKILYRHYRQADKRTPIRVMYGLPPKGFVRQRPELPLALRKSLGDVSTDSEDRPEDLPKQDQAARKTS
jgi:hypothetical protein